MADTCWIKDEHGRFIGRRPGCKMEKSGGVREISDNKTNDDEAASDAALEEEAKAHGKSVEDYKKEKRAMEILRKPQSQWTEEEKRFMKDYDSLEANPAGNPVDAIAFALAGPMAGIARTVLGNIAMDITMEKLTKYAEENFPGYGAIGVVLAAIALGITKGKGDPKAAEKAAAAVKEEKAAATAEKSAAEEAERKASAAAEKKASEAERKAGAAVAEQKAAEESAKAKEKIGEIYDETANYKYKAKSDAEKEAIKANTGDIKGDEAKKLNEEAAKANSSIKNFDGYKTEAPQDRIEHSMSKHSDVKGNISNVKEANGEKVKDVYKTPEEKRFVEGGKHNVSLTKEDYQNIENFRKEALDRGSVNFQPITERKKFESVEYVVPQKDVIENGVIIKKGGDIHMIYKIDPVNKKMTFVTMWKVGYE